MAADTACLLLPDNSIVVLASLRNCADIDSDMVLDALQSADDYEEFNKCLDRVLIGDTLTVKMHEYKNRPSSSWKLDKKEQEHLNYVMDITYHIWNDQISDYFHCEDFTPLVNGLKFDDFFHRLRTLTMVMTAFQIEYNFPLTVNNQL